ncbi:alpha/beta hydrolase [Mycobacterium talmoniae]|uniref:Esterase family protein n=1 Tax=Mycobacterium talmoniae TaxID=1858794 RepID=A0A1S1NK26_9MYCO|nr:MULTISPECIES: alpha/beta hydrolase-fold protein [Mycobacterium]OHV04818.1 hypothetical protein BKN37_08245 [Mycobacterium talmoniae]TDH56957.1 esterase family protein [Mycobacterium eburneum]
MHGWLPLTVQCVAVLVLLAAIGWRSRRWRRLWLPVAAVLGVAAAALVHWYIAANGLADDPAPTALWVWIALTGLAAAVAALGWRSARWWRRGASALAVSACLLSALLALNLWVGYFPTVQTAWNQLTAGPLPGQIDRSTLEAMTAAGTLPRQGRVLPVTIPADASHFRHRGELVYLPPVWFTHTPPPSLPTVMMIGGEFNTPADWLRTGNAVQTLDDFAAAHGGNAPVVVFVDSGGSFNNDTECVNGPRGNAADHLTKDVVPYLISDFGVSPRRENWGIVGWSMGGTCAVDLAVMHPDLFSGFVDIAGDLGPSSGTKAQSIARLFGGNADAWAAFDPTTVMTRHGRYTGLSGWFDVNATRGAASSPTTVVPIAETAGPASPTPASEQLAAAQSLCRLGRTVGIDCAVVTQPGKHDWPFAAQAFRAALPWLAGVIGTPGVTRVGLPLSSPAAR